MSQQRQQTWLVADPAVPRQLSLPQVHKALPESNTSLLVTRVR